MGEFHEKAEEETSALTYIREYVGTRCAREWVPDDAKCCSHKNRKRDREEQNMVSSFHRQ